MGCSSSYYLILFSLLSQDWSVRRRDICVPTMGQVRSLLRLLPEEVNEGSIEDDIIIIVFVDFRTAFDLWP